MGDFKDRLWRDLEREHGADLARIERAAHRRPRRRVVALGAAGLAAAGTALLVALGTSGTPPAFAVQRHADGKVTVTIYRAEGIRGANARLEALHVNVRAVPFVAGCARLPVATAARVPAAMRRALSFARARQGAIMSVGIDPRRLRRGKVVVVAAGPGQVNWTARAAELKAGQVPQCVGTLTPGPPPAPGSIVCHTTDGKTVPFPPKVAPGAAFNSGASGSSGASGNSGAGGNSDNSGNSGAGDNSGASGTSGPPRRGIVCQAHIAHPGPSGNSGNSGASGVTGNS